MATRYTIAELDRMGRVVYATARSGIACEPYDALPDWRRHRWRQAGLAAVRIAAEVDAERRERWLRERRTTVRVNA